VSEEHERHHLRTPTARLSHAEKLQRQQRHPQILTVVLVVVTAMLVYAAAFDLESPGEWTSSGRSP
jgi:hypothetical protein